MNEEINTRENILPVPAAEADRLLACADGLTALLYLHIRRSGGFSVTQAARDLRCPAGEIDRAADNLRRLGLMPQEQMLRGPDELPQYSGEEIAARARVDSDFEGVLFEAQQAFGRLLGSNDLRILYGIYDHLGLPPEVICLLINHCLETYRTAHGEGRTPTMRYIEKEAWHWLNAEIVTFEDAEEHIRREKERKQLSSQVKDVLQIRGRGLTATERKYVSTWLELGFGPETIAVAYDRTVVGTGKLTWKYMDKILRDWHSKSLFTPEQIERGDTRRKTKTAPASTPAPDAASSRDVANLRKLYESIRRGE